MKNYSYLFTNYIKKSIFLLFMSSALFPKEKPWTIYAQGFGKVKQVWV